jgi:CRISPR-associated protein Csx14
MMLPGSNHLSASHAEGHRAFLVATLGTEPQVVTLTLQALVVLNQAVSDVVVIHTAAADARIAAAVRTLDETFLSDDRLAPWAGHYRRAGISGPGGPVADMLDAEDFGTTLAALYSTVRNCKADGGRVHLNLTGGRKLMALCGMTVAQLLFDDDDRLWYLQSPPDLVASKALFANDPRRLTLVAIPLLRWSPAPPILTDLALADDPVAALTWQHEQLAAAKRRFLAQELTEAERAAAELVIRTGAPDAELARLLHKSPRTISHQLTVVYDKLRVFMGVREDVRVDRHTLIAEFAGVVQTVK